MSCRCDLERHACRLVALTGGPSAGKTAVLEVVRRHFCQHVAVLPEAASIIFGGGFPRGDDPVSLRAAQRAIYAVQRELERRAVESGEVAVALCDRGTLDGLAYWPGGASEFFSEIGSTEAEELARYDAVIHLHTPGAAGYSNDNPLRIESASDALVLDRKVADVWSRHPHRVEIESAASFLDKLRLAIAAVRDVVPACCREHAVPELDG